MEIHVDGTLFTVHINPYFLRLNFPHSVVEDDETSARYDPSSGYLAVTLTKETKGQVFEDLDLLAKLLAPRTSEARDKEPLGTISSMLKVVFGPAKLFFLKASWNLYTSCKEEPYAAVGLSQ